MKSVVVAASDSEAIGSGTRLQPSSRSIKRTTSSRCVWASRRSSAAIAAVGSGGRLCPRPKGSSDNAGDLFICELLEKRGNGAKINRDGGGRLRGAVLSSPAAQRPEAEFELRAAHPPQRARGPHLVDVGARAIDASFKSRGSVEWSAPIVGMGACN